ncbi:hypothetical protein [Hyperthermus butylicus]|uniref:Uncharacterized protein n=1 Tax=Hyperthermus butylicus (strain DSM 5456 / JCM 9403 / PLM1-5) TaxID=415426 RepID=A2BMH1_HYPBU|nr:hypothetical protein [Hyperthermus butylicus]ABM81182.1 hypothetical protein Hbut_1355 [Hyperthermus butylicus DSM 5456]
MKPLYLLILAALIGAAIGFAVVLYNSHSWESDMSGASSEASSPPNISIPEGRYVVILGSLGCPHCRALKAFFEDKLPGVALFCSIDARDSTCARAFASLVTARITMGVPTSVVCDNSSRRVVAIVLGEYGDVAGWRQLLNLSPAQRIPVYTGSSIVGYVEPRDHTEFYKLLCLDTLQDAERLG